MEAIFDWICQYADHAHWIFFVLLMLAGLNFPISEDIVLLTGGAIASRCIPESVYYIYAWIYMGCWLSGMEVYWIGRLLGPKLYRYQWFLRFVNPERIEKLHYYYEKFGIWTFICGRFIPGGVRNALFMSSGLGKMPFLTFITRDAIACLISSSTIYTLGFQFGKHYHAIVGYLKTYNLVIITALLLVALILITRHKLNQRNQY